MPKNPSLPPPPTLSPVRGPPPGKPFCVSVSGRRAVNPRVPGVGEPERIASTGEGDPGGLGEWEGEGMGLVSAPPPLCHAPPHRVWACPPMDSGMSRASQYFQWVLKTFLATEGLSEESYPRG